MKEIKRILWKIRKKENVLLFTLLLSIFFVACGNNSNQEGKNTAEPAVVTVMITSTPQPTPEPEIIIKEVTVIVTPSPTPEPTPTPTLPPELEGEGETMTYLLDEV